MGWSMEITARLPVFFKRSASLLLFLLIANGLFAESKKDTLVYKARRNTVRLAKAQLYELQGGNSMLFYRPRPFEFAKNVPSDIYLLGKAAFSKKNLPKLGLILAGSALLVAVDQPITDAAIQFGRYINLDPARKSKTLVEFNIGNFHVNALEIPDNVNSTIYYLGEGWASILIAGGFYSYGLGNQRLSRSSDHITNRGKYFCTWELPPSFSNALPDAKVHFRAMADPNPVPGGDWHPFPAPVAIPEKCFKLRRISLGTFGYRHGDSHHPCFKLSR